MGSLWNQMITGISKSRNITPQYINDIANNLSVHNPQDALNYKVIDGLKYEDEAIDEIKKQIKTEKDDKIHFVSLSKYNNAPYTTEASDNKIAIIYAVGEIESGTGDDEKMGSETIAKALKEARLDPTIKAIVFRVNSPGGSALASDVMWREVLLAKQAKPVIVSMGDVAASGGYYIACAGSYIFAQPNTITGSIGVFGMIPNAQKALANKLGITIDTVNTNKHSDVGTILRPATTDEFNYIQQSVENVYDVFITKVAQGRGLTKNGVDSIAQGRVWSGSDAIKIKLVDELGGITNAINYAVKTAKLINYKTVDMPKQTDPLTQLLNQGNDEMEARAMKANLGEQYIYVKQIKNVLIKKGIQARLPYEMIIE
jgi:protease IV